jgi:hypothetical protein
MFEHSQCDHQLGASLPASTVARLRVVRNKKPPGYITSDSTSSVLLRVLVLRAACHSGATSLTNHVGLINATALAHYVARDVSSLTGGKQNPDMEVRFDTTVFAVAL